MIPPQLVKTIQEGYGIRVSLIGSLSGGEECEVKLVDSPVGRLVLRISPPWRSARELEWSYELARHAAGYLAQAVCPLLTRGGGTVIVYESCPLSL
ncbi:MAG: putative homoserine kinase type (protein kinase fold)-like protein, partial [Dehalococcoidia bacterium]|nr:putative homoserine kinase type (protein kinase fold)-like protein [Dehalococcoidia bacterium]